jgi:hypothetical protein
MTPYKSRSRGLEELKMRASEWLSAMRNNQHHTTLFRQGATT